MPAPGRHRSGAAVAQVCGSRCRGCACVCEVAAQAAKTAGWTAEQTKRTWLRKDVPDHAAFRFVLVALETCGYTGKEVVRFANRLGNIACWIGRIPKGAFVRWAMQLLSETVQRGNAEMYCQSGLIISREQGVRYDAGVAVAVLMS